MLQGYSPDFTSLHPGYGVVAVEFEDNNRWCNISVIGFREAPISLPPHCGIGTRCGWLNFQCRNLDGVFEISADIPDTPVLLVDDVIDSGWTMTVLAALLRQTGSGPVYPVALASTSTGK